MADFVKEWKRNVRFSALHMNNNTVFVTGEPGLFLFGVDAYVKSYGGKIPFPMKDFRELQLPEADELVELLKFELV
jgi:hypothetical protein